jgi:hypothetical protein
MRKNREAAAKKLEASGGGAAPAAATPTKSTPAASSAPASNFSAARSNSNMSTDDRYDSSCFDCMFIYNCLNMSNSLMYF